MTINEIPDSVLAGMIRTGCYSQNLRFDAGTRLLCLAIPYDATEAATLKDAIEAFLEFASDYDADERNIQVLTIEDGQPRVFETALENLQDDDGELPGTFANEPEQDRIHELMSQVAREAIASVNETAAAPQYQGRLIILYVFANGQWQTLERACQGSPIAHAPIQPYADAEELADALRASL